MTRFKILGLQLVLLLGATSSIAAVSPTDCLGRLLNSLNFRPPSELSYQVFNEISRETPVQSYVQLGTQKLLSEIAARRLRVQEFQFIREEAEKRGLRVWLFGGTAASLSHYIRWDLLREQGDSRFQSERFDYDYTNIYRSSQDLDIVIDGSAEEAHQFEKLLKNRFPYFLGQKATQWEVRSLREPRGDKGAILGDFGFINQHTDSNSTSMVELTDPPEGGSVVRDARDWENPQTPQFLKDLNEGILTFYYSSRHSKTIRARSGKNPPIFGVIRALTKAFQYELKIREQDLRLMYKEIQRFNPESELSDPYAWVWIEKNGIKLFQHAVDLEYAWNVLERLGLRSKLISIQHNVDEIGSLAWWMNKEPLRKRPLGEGSGRTAQSLGIKVVAHETSDYAAYESITRSHTGAPNVFISRKNNSRGESAIFGDGFYTVIGVAGARWTGITIRFELDPRAREGTDFSIVKDRSFSFYDDDLNGSSLPSGSYIIIKNRNAIRVIPESLNLSPKAYFQFLAEGRSVDNQDSALLWKFKRKLENLATSVRISDEEINGIRSVALNSIKKLGFVPTPFFQEWISIELARLKFQKKEIEEFIQHLNSWNYQADPAPFIEVMSKISQGTLLENDFNRFIPSLMMEIKDDIGNRSLEKCIFSPHQQMHEFGLRILTERKKQNSDPFINALDYILKQGGDALLWIKGQSSSSEEIEAKTAYLSLHPEYREFLMSSELQMIKSLFKNGSFFTLFEKNIEKNWLKKVRGESFQFKSFEFLPSANSEETQMRPFEIQLTPVTQLQWVLIMKENPSSFYQAKETLILKDEHISFDLNRPVETVTWNEVHEFISKLNDLDPEYVYRLPTEAEWEFTTRAGTNTVYPFGDDYRDLQNYAWYSRNACARTHNVASLKPNAFGLYDMLGNVSEWVEDGVIDPLEPSSAGRHTVRGGSWADQAGNVRSAMSSSQDEYYLSSFTGFRLVRSRR